MKRFEYFDHTADTLLRAYGKDLEEAFGNLILAVYNVIVDTSAVKSVVERKIVVESARKESLVYDVVNELLFLQDTEGFLGASVKRVKLASSPVGWSLIAVIVGDTNSASYDVFGQIKSATYNEMEIGEQKGNVFIQAVLDL